jgi:hypothetical protein
MRQGGNIDHCDGPIERVDRPHQRLTCHHWFAALFGFRQIAAHDLEMAGNFAAQNLKQDRINLGTRYCALASRFCDLRLKFGDLDFNAFSHLRVIAGLQFHLAQIDVNGLFLLCFAGFSRQLFGCLQFDIQIHQAQGIFLGHRLGGFRCWQRLSTHLQTAVLFQTRDIKIGTHIIMRYGLVKEI